MPDPGPLLDALWDLAIPAFLLVSGLAFVVGGALAFRRAADSPRGWDRALHALLAVMHVFFGLLILWVLVQTST